MAQSDGVIRDFTRAARMSRMSGGDNGLKKLVPEYMRTGVREYGSTRAYESTSRDVENTEHVDFHVDFPIHHAKVRIL
jgi:hypothetical protein